MCENKERENGMRQKSVNSGQIKVSKHTVYGHIISTTAANSSDYTWSQSLLFQTQQ